MIKMYYKQILSLFTVFLIFISVFSFSVSAANEDYYVSIDSIQGESDDSSYNQFTNREKIINSELIPIYTTGSGWLTIAGSCAAEYGVQHYWISDFSVNGTYYQPDSISITTNNLSGSTLEQASSLGMSGSNGAFVVSCDFSGYSNGDIINFTLQAQPVAGPGTLDGYCDVFTIYNIVVRKIEASSYYTNVNRVIGLESTLFGVNTLNGRFTKRFSGSFSTAETGDLTVTGWCALPYGVQRYTLTVYINNKQYSQLFYSSISNKYVSWSITDSSQSVKDYVGTKVFGNYQYRGAYTVTVHLSEFTDIKDGDLIDIAMSASSNFSSSYTQEIFFITGIKYDVPDEETETETETETESESESESDSESESGSEGEDPEEQPSYWDGYSAGYNAAIRDLNEGIFIGGTLTATFGFTVEPSSPYYYSSVNDNLFNTSLTASSVSFNRITDYYRSSPPVTTGSLTSIVVKFLFGTYITWEDDLLYFTGVEGSPVPSVILYGSDGTPYLGQVSERSGSPMKAYSISCPEIVSDTTIASIEFSPFPVSTALEILPTLQLNASSSYFAFNKSSYNEGYAAGYDAADEKIRDAKAEAYESGKKVGYIAGFEEGLDSEYNFNNLFFSIFDAQVDTYRSMLSFDIFGVNIATFVMSFVSIALVAWVIKKVW